MLNANTLNQNLQQVLCVGLWLETFAISGWYPFVAMQIEDNNIIDRQLNQTNKLVCDLKGYFLLSLHQRSLIWGSVRYVFGVCAIPLNV